MVGADYLVFVSVLLYILFQPPNGLLISNLHRIGRRREGYEFMIGPPKVINREVKGKKLEPFEVIILFFVLQSNVEWKLVIFE